MIPRYIGHSNFKPFDPIELSKETEVLISNGRRRKYLDKEFSLRRSFEIISGSKNIVAQKEDSWPRAIGCNLRCNFCYTPLSRDYPEKFGSWFTSAEVFEKDLQILFSFSSLPENLRRKKWLFPPFMAFFCGDEMTLGRNHLLEMCYLVEDSPYFYGFVLVTNGIIFGYDKSFVRDLAKFKKGSVRLSIKAGTPESFEKRTGGLAKFFWLPFEAIKNCLDYNMPLSIALMSDPLIMGVDERQLAIKHIAEVAPNLLVQEEKLWFSPFTKFRLFKAGILSKLNDSSLDEIRPSYYGE